MPSPGKRSDTSYNALHGVQEGVPSGGVPRSRGSELRENRGFRRRAQRGRSAGADPEPDERPRREGPLEEPVRGNGGHGAEDLPRRSGPEERGPPPPRLR